MICFLDEISRTNTLTNKVACLCFCGKVFVRKASTVLYVGVPRSCGCLGNTRKEKFYISKVPIYGCFQDMKQRCLNPKKSKFSDYGGRGITICDEWLQPAPAGFLAFKEWAYNKYPNLNELLTLNYSLDRIDNNGNYEPNNCKFATKKEQCANRRNTIMVEYNGVLSPLSEIVELYGIVSNRLVSSRLRLGWNLEKALKTPKRAAKYDN